MKILFMGTPDIAASCLSTLCDSHHTVVAAVTQADRPRGRGHKLLPPPVKELAQQRGLPVYQPDTLRGDVFAALLEELAPEVIVVVAYGKILPSSVLDYPRYGCVNLHASLLPHYRGAAPIQRAIMAGETETGLTTMYMDAGLDTGDILLVERMAIAPQDTFGTVYSRMAAQGGALLCRTLDAIADGSIVRQPQPESGACYAAKIEKEDCHLDITRPAAELDPYLRGLSPVPGAYLTRADGRKLKLLRAEVAAGQGAPGTVLEVSDRGEGGILLACGKGALLVREVVPEGKGRMMAADYVRGRGIAPGDLLT